MRFLHLDGTFGALDGGELSFGPGLNVITGRNESGKSTWCGLILTMLYGLESRRDKAGYLSDKTRFAPWSGQAMRGRLELELEGRRVVIERSSRSGSSMQLFSARDGATGEPLSGLSAKNAGEMLTGVGRETYVRSAFIAQNGLALSASSELEGRIQSLLTSGQEDTSYSSAEQWLRVRQNRRRHNKTGLLPRLEQQQGEKNESLQRLEGLAARQNDLVGRIRRGGERLGELERIHALLARQKVAHKAEELRQARAEADGLERELEKARAGLPSGLLDGGRELLGRVSAAAERHLSAENRSEECRRQAQDAQQKQTAAERQLEGTCPALSGLSGEEAWQKALGDAARYEQLLAQKEKGAAPRWWYGIVAAVLLGFVGFLLLSWAGAAVGIALGLGMTVFLAYRQKNDRGGDAVSAAEGGLILAGYGQTEGSGADGIRSAASEYRVLLDSLLALEAQSEDARQQLEAALGQEERQRQELMELLNTLCPDTKSEPEEIQELVGRWHRQLDQYEQMKGRLERARVRCELLSAQAAADEEPDEPQEAAPHISFDGDEKELAGQIERLREGVGSLERELAAVEGEMRHFGDPYALRSELEEVQEQMAALQREYDALELARTVLGQADGQMRARFAPELGVRAGALMERMAGPGYGAVTVDRSFDPRVGGPAMGSHGVLELSRGTADQLYLAVRLAVCDYALPQTPRLPIVLDDVFVNFDDGRLHRALDFLVEEAQSRQILLFTCHARESDYLSGNPMVHTIQLPQRG